MSTLDRAFIKAYEQPAAPAAVAPALQAAPKPAPRTVRRTTRTAGARRAAPAKRVAASAAAPAPKQPPQAAGGHPLPGPHWTTAASVLPASAAAARAATTADTKSIDALADLLPAYEVPAVVWPQIVLDLLRSAGPELQASAAELREDARRGLRLRTITSWRRGAGRSTVLLALARILAAEGLRIVLVDGDFARPQMADLLGLAPQAGWEDVFTGKLELADALIESSSDRLVVLPLRHAVARPESLVGNVRLGLSLRTLCEHYDLVLVDSGPLSEEVSLIDVVSPAVDSLQTATVVQDRRQAGQEELAAAGERLAARGVVQWDVAHNFV